jgi:hypothetical protein
VASAALLIVTSAVAHAVKESVGMQQPKPERRGDGPGHEVPGGGVQKDLVVGQKLVASL